MWIPRHSCYNERCRTKKFKYLLASQHFETLVDSDNKKLRFLAKEEEEIHAERESNKQLLTKKDAFMMSFLALLLGGVIIAAIFLMTEGITGNAVLDLSGGKVGDTNSIVAVDVPTAPAPEPVAESVPEPAPAPVVETVVETNVTETNVTLTPVTNDDTIVCGEDVTLNLGESEKYNKKTIIMTLGDSSAAQLSVGGKKGLISRGETSEINGLSITLHETTSDTAVITIGC